MDTLVTIEVVHATSSEDCAPAIGRAFDRFRQVEETCSRFDPVSELRRLSAQPGATIPVSPALFEALRFALALAKATRGAFDPTIGATLEQAGFNRNFRTGEVVDPAPEEAARPDYRDVALDEPAMTVTLKRQLVLDLGAVAKGLAIDLAARELSPYGNFSIDAGGDIFVAGSNPEAEPWHVGIRHPREPGEVLASLAVTDLAVCTSGDYERRSGEAHHILDPATGASAGSLASVTVVAPTAMAADALATAAFVLGPERGARFLRRQGVDWMLVTSGMKRHQSRGFRRLVLRAATA